MDIFVQIYANLSEQVLWDRPLVPSTTFAILQVQKNLIPIAWVDRAESIPSRPPAPARDVTDDPLFPPFGLSFIFCQKSLLGLGICDRFTGKKPVKLFYRLTGKAPLHR